MSNMPHVGITNDERELPVSKFSHFGITTVELESCWIYQCRACVILDLLMLILSHCGFTNIDYDSGWIYQY